MNGNCVRSTFEIKRGLLRKAWDGQSKYSGAEMIAMINERTKRARDIPIEHEIELATIEDNESRYIRAFNIIAEKEGSPHRLKDNTVKPSAPTIH